MYMDSNMATKLKKKMIYSIKVNFFFKKKLLSILRQNYPKKNDKLKNN